MEDKPNETFYAALCKYTTTYTKEPYGSFNNDEIGNICSKYIHKPLEYIRADSDAEVLFAQGKSGELYFIFFPSNSALDWEKDFDMLPHYINNTDDDDNDDCVYIHKGFHDQYCGLNAFIKRKSTKYPDEKIIFCGFSLGGALAMIAGYDYQHRDIEIHTIAAPAVGNKVFASYFNQNKVLTRIVLEDDPVPLVPPGYVQPIEPVYLKMNGSVHDNIPLCDRIRTMLCILPQAFKTKKLTGNHNLDTYFEILKKNNL
jgi:hypothetical protein